MKEIPIEAFSQSFVFSSIFKDINFIFNMTFNEYTQRMKNLTHPTFLPRFSAAVIFFMHSFFTIMDGSVNDFGRLYLDPAGFAPLGLYIAWAVKLVHLISVPLLLLNKYIKPVVFANLAVLIAGIIMVHWKEGWFVVGGGRNGMEFNFLLIFVLLTILFPQGLGKKKDPMQ
jgi:putative oxidoreductase